MGEVFERGKRIRETGLVDSRTQIRQTSWETREFHVRDLDGHGLTFYCDL